MPKQFPAAGRDAGDRSYPSDGVFASVLPDAAVFWALPERNTTLCGRKFAVEYDWSHARFAKAVGAGTNRAKFAGKAMEPCDILLVHDAVRPLVTQEVIERVMV